MSTHSTQVRLSPVVRFVRALDGEYYLLSEVAAVLEVPVTTLRRLKRENPRLWGPSFRTHYGDQLVYLYTPEDLARLARRYAAIRRDNPARITGCRGRPPLWSRQERQERQRRFAQATYAHRQAEALRLTDPTAAKEANRRYRLTLKALRAEAKARRAEVATRV